MAALAATTPTNTGTVTAGAVVSSSDTIAQSVLGSLGAYLLITNAGAGVDNVTISDAGLTPAGNPLPSGNMALDAVATGTSQIYIIRPAQVNPLTGLVTVAHSQPTGVTYQLWPVGI
jgi:hypothetical protein